MRLWIIHRLVLDVRCCFVRQCKNEEIALILVGVQLVDGGHSVADERFRW